MKAEFCSCCHRRTERYCSHTKPRQKRFQVLESNDKEQLLEQKRIVEAQMGGIKSISLCIR